MLTRISSGLLLGSLLLLSSGIVSGAPPAITLVVPDYQYPQDDALLTQAAGIANNGTITGSVFTGTDTEGFIRYADGEFSPLFNFPGVYSTYPLGVNSSNLVCGYYLDTPGGTDHGVFYDGTAFTQYDAPGATSTRVTGINDTGDFCGDYVDANSGEQIAFTNTGGTLVTFAIPGATFLSPAGINNLGQVVGSYNDVAAQRTYGFFRDADGTLTYPLHHSGSTQTLINGINDEGLMVGYYVNRDGQHSFVLRSPFGDGGSVIYYDFPDPPQVTNFGGINNSRLISGIHFYGSSFIAQLVH